jgi:cell wall assembly regulator SMI1
MAERDQELVSRMEAFRWPETAPVSLDEAWRFLDDNPLPADRFVLREAAATESALDEAERDLGRALPPVLRQALTRHDGIEETWSRSGPFLAGARELAAEWTRFEREWSQLQELMAEGEIEAEDWRGIGPDQLHLDSLFPLGHEQGGHICFVLDASRTSSAGQHPVLWFDPETPAIHARWQSLGHFIAWIVCDAYCHPQRQPPPQLDRLFPFA